MPRQLRYYSCHIWYYFAEGYKTMIKELKTDHIHSFTGWRFKPAADTVHGKMAFILRVCSCDATTAVDYGSYRDMVIKYMDIKKKVTK
jgi:hypothetical protein